MENASKALLIAGAILIAMAVIGVGVAIFRDSKIFVNVFGDKLTNSEVQKHNNVYIIYEGQVTGSEVINACIKARELNSRQKKINMTIEVICGAARYSFNNSAVTQYDTILNLVAKNYKSNIFNGNIVYDNSGVLSTLKFVLK